MILKPASIDKHFSTEWQLGLLNEAAYKVWDKWCKRNGKMNMSQGEKVELENILQQSIIALYKQCREADVFLSGVKVGRTQSEEGERR